MKNHITICKVSVLYSQVSINGAILNAQYSRAIGEVGVREANIGIGIGGYSVGNISMFKMSYVGSINSIFGSAVGKTG